jgi:hypothetical protein
VRRYVRPMVDAAVWCPSGRWGPRRVRVSECAGVLQAEDVYTDLIRSGPSRLRLGVTGTTDWALPGRQETVYVTWELRPNAVWRFGRVFLRCPQCERLASRLYVPRVGDPHACRRCWGLTYESRQLRSYKPGRDILSTLLGPLAYWTTVRDREERAEASRRRWAMRRDALTRMGYL